MRIADAEIPIQHTTVAVTSNLAFILAAVVVAAAAGRTGLSVGILGGMASFALVMQGVGSSLFHGTRNGERWARLLDAIGIQMVMSALVGLAFSPIIGTPSAVLAVLIAWTLWWTEGDELRRHYAIAGQGALVLGLLGITVGWMQALALGGVMAVALTLWATSSTHSLPHALWHILSAVAQAGAAVLLL